MNCHEFSTNINIIVITGISVRIFVNHYENYGNFCEGDYGNFSGEDYVFFCGCRFGVGRDPTPNLPPTRGYEGGGAAAVHWTAAFYHEAVRRLWFVVFKGKN